MLKGSSLSEDQCEAAVALFEMYSFEFKLTSSLNIPGQGGDSPMFPVVMEAVRVPRIGGGRARTRPGGVIGEKAYSSRANRELLRGRGIKAVI